MSDDAARESTLIAALGYVPLLFPLSLAVGRRDRFVRFHGLQSMALLAVLFVGQVTIWTSDLLVGRVLGSVLLIGFVFRALAWVIHYPFGIVLVCVYLVLTVVCGLHAAAGNSWRVPVLAVYLERLQERSG